MDKPKREGISLNIAITKSSAENANAVQNKLSSSSDADSPPHIVISQTISRPVEPNTLPSEMNTLTDRSNQEPISRNASGN